jgi:ComF family protein
LLFPPRCVHCDADLLDRPAGLLLCASCAEMLGPTEWTGCPKCGAALSPESPCGERCAHCRGYRLHFDTVVPLCGYRDSLRLTVLLMKRTSGEPLANAMGALYCLRRKQRLAVLEPSLVVPIPMHWTRRMVRRTNSPEIVAAQIARELGIPLANRLLRRRRRTQLQPHLKPRERFANVRGAFELASGDGLAGATALLVDDVLTTGATSSEAAKVLKQAGAARVVVAVLAKADGDDAM